VQLDKTGAPRRAVALACCLSATAVMSPLDLALAQEGEYPSNAVTHPGEIVYSRDVPYGTATRRFDQGEARTVSPDQSALIMDSLLNGLEPLNDSEQESVSAPLTRALDSTQSALQAGLSALTSVQSSDGDFNRADAAADRIGGIVNNSLSAMSGAIGVIGKVLGDGE
jgi:hypothetical protein